MLPHQTSLTKYFFILFVGLVLVYAYITAQDMLYGPQIVVDTPAEGITVTSSAVEITGTVKNVSVLRLEGAIIPVDENGTFTETLIVAPGINTFVLSAEDTFGRAREKSFSVLYNTPTPDTVEPTTSIDTETLPDVSSPEGASTEESNLIE